MDSMVASQAHSSMSNIGGGIASVPSAVASSHQRQDDAFHHEIAQAVSDLIRGQRQGHCGQYGYFNGGGILFADFIRNNPSYHPYWAEKSLLERKGEVIAQDVADTERVVVVGQGPSFADKEWQIIKHLKKLKRIDFIDVSQKFNDMAIAQVKDLKSTLPRGVKLYAHTTDFRTIAAQDLKDINPKDMITTVICTGSLVTNQDKSANGKYPESEFKADIRDMSRLTGGRGHLIVGYDTNDEILKLHSAYRNPFLEKFYYNCLEFMFQNAEGVRLEDSANQVILPNKNSLSALFAFETLDRFDPQTRNYPHIMRAKVPFFAYIDHDGEQDKVSIEAGTEFVLMNCYKPRPNRISTLAEESAERSKHFGIKAKTGYLEDGMIVQTFAVTPR